MGACCWTRLVSNGSYNVFGKAVCTKLTAEGPGICIELDVLSFGGVATKMVVKIRRNLRVPKFSAFDFRCCGFFEKFKNGCWPEKAPCT